jgi:hypothetical protein
MKIFRLSRATEWRPEVAHGKTVGFVVKTRQAPEWGERNARRSIFCRPIRGWDIFWTIQPTVLPWATFCRASGTLITTISFFALGAMAQTTNGLTSAEIQGRQLAQQLLEQSPTTNFFQNGILKIRDKARNITNVFVFFQTHINTDNWQADYEAGPTANGVRTVSLRIIHKNGQSDRYLFIEDKKGLFKEHLLVMTALNENEIMIPFAKSDFWIADLGLEFFHWPEQKLLKKEVKRSRGCSVLQSTNPGPFTNGYSRVVSWIDNESGGIVQAEAYDLNNKLLKEFAPKSFKKVNGQWELQEMEIRNVQTGSRTRLEFDLKKE